MLPQRETFYIWDKNTNAWIESSYGINTYTASGNIASKVTYVNEIAHSKSLYSYDASGNQIEEMQYLWEGFTWQKSSKYPTEYDSVGFITQFICYDYYFMEIFYGYKKYYSYNLSRTRVDTTITEEYNPQTKLWTKNIEKIAYYANSTDTQFNYFEEYFSNGNAFVLNSKASNVVWKSSSIINPDNQKAFLSYTTEAYNSTSGQWKKSRFTNTFDDYDNIILFQNEEFIDGSWDSTYYRKYTNTYNGNGAMIEVIMEEMGDSLLHKTKTEYSDFITVASTSVFIESNNLTLNIYPNPVVEKLIFNNPEPGVLDIIIYSSVNQAIVHETTSGFSVELNVSALSAGLYLVKAQTASGKIYTSKIRKD